MSWDNNIVSANINRQIQDNSRLKFERKFHLTDRLIKRLGMIHELKEHTKCVNCLEWHDSGQFLASGSDDCNIVLWNPYKRKCVKTIQSGHTGNIFSVKYVKSPSGNCIASGAADAVIRVHDMVASECILNCTCHTNRVKRLATPSNEPNVFMSAAEDGFVLQFDLREKHWCSQICNNVLINLTSHISPSAEVKCISINPVQPHLLAIGANDPYIRLYDRRMISLTQAKHPPSSSISFLMSSFGRAANQQQENDDPSWVPPPSNLPHNCVQYFIAGHLHSKKKPAVTCTYVSFNSKGNELLANLGSEQIYLYDINKVQTLHSYYLPSSTQTTVSSKKTSSTSNKNSTNGTCEYNGKTNGTKNQPTAKTKNGFHRPSNLKYYSVYGVKQLLPPKVQLMKEQANERFDKGDYINAVWLYNKAIVHCPNAAVLHGNRAIALMKRGWDGDVYAALRDCYKALELDKGYFRAHFRMARCLSELKRYKEAHECFEKFKSTFPEEAKDQSCSELEKQIKDCLERLKEREEASTSSKGESPRNLSFNSRLPNLNEKEITWRARAADFKQRFCGHCNTTTDIKEANFFGRDDQYVVAGSDDGNIFIWDRKTTNIVRVLKADEAVVNCLQPHPTDCLLATSGIEKTVKLWAPKPEDGPDSVEPTEVEDINEAASSNQKLMYENQTGELAIYNMGYRFRFDSDNSEYPEELVQCRAIVIAKELYLSKKPTNTSE
uniref:WD and tetratricopeptide repeats protein 1 n=1 Tax=Tetranychus urticae TaxID=32264 RepID=T1KVK3_TETUR